MNETERGSRPGTALGCIEAEAADLAAELLPRLAPAVRGPADVRRRLASYRTAATSWLENARRLRRGDECLRPAYFIWTMTNRCNFACEYCDNHRGEKYPDLPDRGRLDTEGGQRLLQVMRTGTSALYFCGGEPTLRNDLPELTREAWNLGYFPLMINTNAALLHRRLATPGWEDWLARMDVVICSLDSLDPGALDTLYVTSDGADVIRNVAALARLGDHTGTKVVVNTVIRPGHVDEAADVFDWAQRTGVWFVPVPVNHGPAVEHSLLDDPGYARLAERILARKRAGGRILGSVRLLERLLGQAHIRCLPTLKAHIDPDATVWWPCKPCVNVAPVKVPVLDHDTLDEVWAAGRRLVDPTGFHGPGPDQCGADCGWAQNYAADLYAEGLRHPLRLMGAIRDFTSR